MIGRQFVEGIDSHCVGLTSKHEYRDGSGGRDWLGTALREGRSREREGKCEPCECGSVHECSSVRTGEYSQGVLTARSTRGSAQGLVLRPKSEDGNTWGALTPSADSPNLFDGTHQAGGGSFGPEISTGKTISNALGGAFVAEVKLAVGGTALFDRWNPAGGDLYDNMVARVNQSIADLQTQFGQAGYVAGFSLDAGRKRCPERRVQG